MSNIDSLHRAMIAAGLRYDEANAPFRVVKHVPAPKPKKRKTK